MVSGVGAQVTNLDAYPSRGFGSVCLGSWTLIRVRSTNLASGVCWGCLSGVHGPGAEVVVEQEATAAAENSLNNH